MRSLFFENASLSRENASRKRENAPSRRPAGERKIKNRPTRFVDRPSCPTHLAEGGERRRRREPADAVRVDGPSRRSTGPAGRRDRKMAKSKSTKSKKMSVGTLASKQVSAILALVQKAATAVAETPRMTVVERKRTAKMKRGAHQVIPLIAVLAQKFGVEAPGSPVVEMSSNMEHAQSLEPLLATLASLYGTVRDEHLRSQADAWSTAIVTYGMLKKAGEANQHIRDELAPVTKWFRH